MTTEINYRVFSMINNIMKENSQQLENEKQLMNLNMKNDIRLPEGKEISL